MTAEHSAVLSVVHPTYQDLRTVAVACLQLELNEEHPFSFDCAARRIEQRQDLELEPCNVASASTGSRELFVHNPCSIPNTEHALHYLLLPSV